MDHDLKCSFNFVKSTIMLSVSIFVMLSGKKRKRCRVETDMLYCARGYSGMVTVT